MNKITLIGLEEQNVSYQSGDIFYDPDDKETYILAQQNNQIWTTFSLKTGYRWDSGETIEEATENLEFFGRDVEITVKKKSV